MKRSITTTVVVLGVATFQGTAGAAGFALIENSASGMGNAFAGAAAVAEDASTVWFNPAGMTRLKQQQVTAALHYVMPSAKYTDEGSYINPALTGDTVEPGSLSGKNASSEVNALVPNLYYVVPLNDEYLFGLGINAPFGLETDYDDDWVGRYHATNSLLMTVNINPSLAWQATDALSFGFGLNIQYAKADLSNQVDSGAVCLKFAGDDDDLLAQCIDSGLVPDASENDSSANVKGDNWAYGYNLGLLYQVNDSIRLGLTYRSAITQELQGDGTFEVNPLLRDFLDADAVGGSDYLIDSPATATADLPASASISGLFNLTQRVVLLADITWTGWSSFEELRVEFDNPVQPDAVTHQNWEDSMRYAVGLNYTTNSYVLRTGLAHDESPIPDEQHRTPRIPGNARSWLSLGLGLPVNQAIWLDFGYAHLFSDDAAIDHTDDNGYALRGVYELAADIFSAQTTVKF